MDAMILRLSLIILSLFVSTGAKHQTPNFVVTAATDDIARRVGEAAEVFRRDLAEFWLGHALPDWSRPCKLRVRTGSIGAGGETKFQFVRGEVLNWDMFVQGSLERILDSVLPHEVNHTIFASHYRRPLPRWADEGAATLFEHRSEQVKQLGLLKQVINSDREFIDLSRLLQMKEYPKGYRPMLIMYAEGYALADFLVQQGGREKYLKLLTDGERIGWTKAITQNYSHEGVQALQKNWKSWILAGMPKLRTSSEQLLAQASGLSKGFRPAILSEYLSNPTVRLQSPDAKTSESAPLRSPVSLSSRNSATARNESTKQMSRGDAVPRTKKNGSRGSAVFTGLPISSSRNVSTTHRHATFEAPKPNSATSRARATARRTSHSSTPIRTSSSVRERSLRSRGSGLERTTFGSGSPIQRNSIDQRKHLPQERRLVTGSIPQWAGFPGQKELF